MEDNKLYTFSGDIVSIGAIRHIDAKIEFVKTHPDAKLPTKAHDEDNCWDLYAVEDVTVPESQGVPEIFSHGSVVNVGNAVVPVGLNVASITPGFGFVIKGRSGMGFKHGIMPHFGEIDNGYRGDLGVKLYNLTSTPYNIKKGDRIAQFKVERVYNTAVRFTEEVKDSTRKDGGFGSSGK
jgi:dUTP pyrophosphatase